MSHFLPAQMIGRPRISLLAVIVVAGIVGVAAVAAAPPGVTVIRIKGGPFVGSVISRYGSIWVTSHRGPYLYRLNPRTNRVVKSISVGENQCSEAAGGGAVWVTNCWGETGHAYVYEINAKKNRVVHRYNGATAAFGDGSLWMRTQNGRTLLRIDPRSRLVLARIAIPTGPTGEHGGPFVAAVCDGSVWLDADTAEVHVDTATNRVAAVVQLPGSLSENSASSGYFSAGSAACAAGKVWVPNLAGLYSIDEQTNTATGLPIAIRPNSQLGTPGVTAAGGQVFVRTSDTTVTRVDAQSGKAVHTYPAGGGGGERIAVGYGSVWIPAPADGAVWRDRIRSP